MLAIREDESASYSHAEKTNVFINEVMGESGLRLNDLAAVAVGAGPGSYTGLRIGASIAKGLCFALDIPLVDISSLHTIANGMRTTSDQKMDVLVPMIDARRDEVFTTFLDSDLNILKDTHPLILDEAGYAGINYDDWYVGGNGAFKVDHANAHMVDGVKTSVRWMASLAERKFDQQDFADLAYFAPQYGKAAQPTKQKKRF
jgi:tRNA threonylcarbamoyladenosine biosynthesis protein TsaB